NGGGNCGLYATCDSSASCKTTCVVNAECISTAACVNGRCKPKSGKGGPCSYEGADDECFSPFVCTWATNGSTGVCSAMRCSGCAAPDPTFADCSDFIAFGQDPRNICPNGDPCVQGGGCAGRVYGSDGNILPAQCEFGLGEAGSRKVCGAVVCTNDQYG